MNAFCTIITADHINYALAVRKSLLDFGNDFTFLILVVDKSEGLKERIEKNYCDTEIIYPDIVCENEIGKAIYKKYFPVNMNAFRWCMKPVFIKYLLEKKFDKVIYTDCDIHFYNDYHFLLEELDKYNVLLTPHWRSSDPYLDLPNFEILYTSGIYNGGFIAAKKSGIPAMDWWAMACEFSCIKDTTKGLFDDQTHLNMLPVYFDEIGIVKHRGCNLANWNMVECKRTLSTNKKNVVINSQYPIVFIHFSKSTRDGILSGVDSLLLPYLQHYYEVINSYSSNLGLPTLRIPIKKKEIPAERKSTGIQKVKRMIKKIIKNPLG